VDTEDGSRNVYEQWPGLDRGRGMEEVLLDPAQVPRVTKHLAWATGWWEGSQQ
jgi:hypothetical protein